ncbi:unnamed protein product [Trichogramma brassicae]|uniref:Uncharacterized protein n=1 Tax=Trichogramma brassicae TaxID=86971 RepID=A0A6H5IWL4_9HYME|nr:unnamed protein product [Trichogramma brassicae]
MVQHLDNKQRSCSQSFEKTEPIRRFILISSVMSWARTKPKANGEAFTEADYRKRRAHPNFKAHLDLERRVCGLAKQVPDVARKLRVLVICCGITFGEEESTLHYAFKMAWCNEARLPVIEPGNNLLPLLHVRNLAATVCGVIREWPKSSCYIVAVDARPTRQDKIIKTARRWRLSCAKLWQPSYLERSRLRMPMRATEHPRCAEFLMRENAEAKMFEPDYNESLSSILETVRRMKQEGSLQLDFDYCESLLLHHEQVDQQQSTDSSDSRDGCISMSNESCVDHSKESNDESTGGYYEFECDLTTVEYKNVRLCTQIGWRRRRWASCFRLGGCFQLVAWPLPCSRTAGRAIVIGLRASRAGAFQRASSTSAMFIYIFYFDFPSIRSNVCLFFPEADESVWHGAREARTLANVNDGCCIAYQHKCVHGWRVKESSEQQRSRADEAGFCWQRWRPRGRRLAGLIRGHQCAGSRVVSARESRLRPHPPRCSLAAAAAAA